MERSRSKQDIFGKLQVADREQTRRLTRIDSQDRSVDWIALTLVNGWVYYGAGWALPAFKRLSNGLVEIKALLARGSAPGTDTVIATLPAGFRPKERRLFKADTSAGHARFDIDTSGNIRYQFGGVAYYSLDGTVFSAEQ